MNEKIAVILGLNDTGLYTSQLFSKYGYKVYGIDYDKENNGFYSKKLQAILTNNPLENPESNLKILINLGSQYNNKPIILATSEIYLYFILTYKHILQNYFFMILPNNEILKKIINKSGQFELAKNLGFDFPEYLVIDNEDAFEEIKVKKFDFPLLIKGDNQPLWKNKELSKSYIVKNYKELYEISKKLFNLKITFIIQKIIPGPITNNYEYNTLVYNGKIICESVIHKIRQYKEPYGSACCIEISSKEIINKLGREYVLKNNIEGFSNTEFKYNPEDGKYYFIECNARVWWQIKLTEHINISYIKNYIDIYEHNIINYKYKKLRHIMWVDFPFDFLLCLRYIRINPLLFIKYLFNYRKVRSFGLLCFNDMTPFFHAIHLIK